MKKHSLKLVALCLSAAATFCALSFFILPQLLAYGASNNVYNALSCIALGLIAIFCFKRCLQQTSYMSLVLVTLCSGFIAWSLFRGITHLSRNANSGGSYCSEKTQLVCFFSDFSRLESLFGYSLVHALWILAPLVICKLMLQSHAGKPA